MNIFVLTKENYLQLKNTFERFLRSANEIGLDLGYTVDELIDLVRQLLNENNVKMVEFIFKQLEV